jgi:hypothetical protein
MIVRTDDGADTAHTSRIRLTFPDADLGSLPGLASGAGMLSTPEEVDVKGASGQTPKPAPWVPWRRFVLGG